MSIHAKTRTAAATGIVPAVILATGTVAAEGPPAYLKETLPEHSIDEMIHGLGSGAG